MGKNHNRRKNMAQNFRDRLGRTATSAAIVVSALAGCKTTPTSTYRGTPDCAPQNIEAIDNDAEPFRPGSGRYVGPNGGGYYYEGILKTYTVEAEGNREAMRGAELKQFNTEKALFDLAYKDPATAVAALEKEFSAWNKGQDFDQWLDTASISPGSFAEYKEKPYFDRAKIALENNNRYEVFVALVQLYGMMEFKLARALEDSQINSKDPDFKDAIAKIGELEKKIQIVMVGANGPNFERVRAQMQMREDASGDPAGTLEELIETVKNYGDGQHLENYINSLSPNRPYELDSYLNKALRSFREGRLSEGVKILENVRDTLDKAFGGDFLERIKAEPEDVKRQAVQFCENLDYGIIGGVTDTIKWNEWHARHPDGDEKPISISR
jgi:hypothetical protein